MQPESQTALIAATSFGAVGQGRLIEASRTTGWRWVRAAAQLATERRQLPPRRNVGSHTLRYSYARHLLMNGIPLNYLIRWLGHSAIKTTLIYLELVPDPTGRLAMVP